MIKDWNQKAASIVPGYVASKRPWSLSRTCWT